MPLDVVYSTSDAYSEIAATSIVSLLINSADCGDVNIYVIDIGISPEHKADLEEAAGAYGGKVRFLGAPDVEAIVGSRIEVGKWHISTFSRLFLATALPEGVDKVIYIDCDMIIRHSLRQVWEADMGGAWCMAADDCRGAMYRRDIGIPRDSIYTNNGFMVIDLKAWRDNGVESMFADFISRHGGDVTYVDQGVLNGVFQPLGKVGLLPISYNAQSACYYLGYDGLQTCRNPVWAYGRDEFERGVADPVVVHFTSCFMSGTRPWQKVDDHPYRHEFLAYRELTPWRDRELWDGDSSLAKEAVTAVCRTLPRQVVFSSVKVLHVWAYPLVRSANNVLVRHRGGKVEGVLVGSSGEALSERIPIDSSSEGIAAIDKAVTDELRVLVITTVKVGFDGLTSHVLSYAKAMDKSDMRIDLVSARGVDPKISDQIKEAGFNNVYRLEWRDTNQAKYFRELLGILKANRYDIVHAHGNSATLAVDLLAAKMAGVPVRIAHSHNTSTRHPVFNAMLKPLFVGCYTDGFACSDKAGQWLFGNVGYTVVPNGREIDRYIFDDGMRKRMRGELLLDDNAIAIAHVAAFVPTKNHKFMIAAFKELVASDSRYELFLFGIDGDTLADVLSLINDLGLQDKVHYMGAKDNLPDYLQAVDIVVLPSLYEGFPITVIESQISGLPCIVSDTVARECDLTGSVTFVPIDQGVGPWVDAILNADIDTKSRAEKAGAAAISRAGFDIKSNAADLKRLYRNLKDERRKAELLDA